MRRGLKLAAAAGVAVGLAAVGGGAWADPAASGSAQPAPVAPAAVPPPDPAVAAELTRMFDEACLRPFPDDAATAAYAAAHGGTPLTPAQVRGLLHDDPGRGWYLRTPLGLYGLTLEAPPFHACGLRRMTPEGIVDVRPYRAAVEAFARTRGLTLTYDAPIRRTTPQGMSVTLFALTARDAAGAIAENLMLILTNYHGRPPDDFRADAKGSVGVEVRMVVQRPPGAGVASVAPERPAAAGLTPAV